MRDYWGIQWGNEHCHWYGTPYQLTCMSNDLDIFGAKIASFLSQRRSLNCVFRLWKSIVYSLCISDTKLQNSKPSFSYCSTITAPIPISINYLQNFLYSPPPNYILLFVVSFNFITLLQKCRKIWCSNLPHLISFPLEYMGAFVEGLLQGILLGYLSAL